MNKKLLSILAVSALASGSLFSQVALADYTGTVTIVNNTKAWSDSDNYQRSGFTINSVVAQKGDQNGCNGEIAPGQSCTYTFDETSPNVFNTVIISMTASGSDPAHGSYSIPLSGNLSFSPTGGLYVDRGWMGEKSIWGAQGQTVQLVTQYTGSANGSVTQNTNGGNQINSNIMNGGSVTLTYSNNNPSK